MAKIRFRKVKLSSSNKERLDTINSIVEEYQEQGYKLTLRQLYYQLVSRDIIPNQQKEYSKLSTLLKEGRMGGVVDWDAIEDRLRVPSKPASFDSPQDILDACINQYALPRMNGQKNYIETWVEKDALSGVLKRVTQQYHIPILVNRGYSSASAMFDAYERFSSAIEKEQTVNVLYLGDFDPSGTDMIRDVRKRVLEMIVKTGAKICHNKFDPDAEDWASKVVEWTRSKFNVIPIALTQEQIRKYNPPPNPAKRSDPRAKEFIAKYGGTSWEVDALRPEVLNQVLTDNIEKLLDKKMFNDVLKREKSDKEKLVKLKEQL
jgi:hypothetical protein